MQCNETLCHCASKDSEHCSSILKVFCFQCVTLCGQERGVARGLAWIM